MKKETRKISIFTILSTMIWMVAMLACALAFKGSDNHINIQLILGGAAAGHLVFIWGPLGTMANKTDNEE